MNPIFVIPIQIKIKTKIFYEINYFVDTAATPLQTVQYILKCFKTRKCHTV